MPPPLRLNPQYLWNALHKNRVTQTVRSSSAISDLSYVLTCRLLDLPVLRRIQHPFAISQRSFVHYPTVSLCSFALDDNSTHTALQQLAAEHACPSTTSLKTSGLHAGTMLGNDAYVCLSPATKRLSVVQLSRIEYRSSVSVLFYNSNGAFSSYVSGLSYLLTSQLLRSCVHGPESNVCSYECHRFRSSSAHRRHSFATTTNHGIICRLEYNSTNSLNE